MIATHRCRTCKAPVVFVKSGKSGKTMILDAEPVDRGNVQIVPTPEGPVAWVQTKELLEKARAEGEPLYLDHHATCPQADAWRKDPA